MKMPDCGFVLVAGGRILGCDFLAEEWAEFGAGEMAGSISGGDLTTESTECTEPNNVIQTAAGQA